MSPDNAELLLYAGLPLVLAGMVALSVWVALDVRSTRLSKLLAVLVNRRALGWALIAAFLGFLATVFVAGQSRDHHLEDARMRFMQLSDQVNADIQASVNALVMPLNGVRGTIVASDSVSPDEFRRMVIAMEPENHLLGVRGLGWIEKLPKSQIAAFEAQQQRLGRPNFRVRTGGDSKDAYVVKYVEPLVNNMSAVGFDIASETLRRSAADSAMRSGRPAITQPIRLLQDKEQRPGFLLVVPVYRDNVSLRTAQDRVRHLRGWAYAPVVWAELLAQTNTFEDHQLDVKIFSDASESAQSLIFDSLNPGGISTQPVAGSNRAQRQFSVMQPVLVMDQVLYVRATADANFEAQFNLKAHRQVALWGGTSSVLAAIIVWLLLAGRSRALSLAQRMTTDLARLAMVAQRTTNAVVITDVQGRVTWVNEGFTRISGYTPDEVMGRNPGALLQTDNTDPLVREKISQGLRNHETVKSLILNRHKDGHDYWIELEIQPLYGAQGEHTGFMAMESDVTDIVHARAALANERERADAILAGTNVGTWESNLQTGASHCNDRWGLMMGYQPQEVQPNADQFWVQHVHPDDLVRSNNAMQSCRQGHADQYSIEVRVRRKDGQWMWILSRAKVMTRASNGDVEWIGGIHTDISETKQLELNLRDMESFLHRAGRLAGVGAWEIDVQSKTLTWSEQTCMIHGFEGDFQPTLEQSMTFYAPESRAQLQVAMDRAIEYGIGWDLTLSLVSAQGKALWVRSTGEPEFDDSGAVRLVGAVQDVTQQRAAQLSIERNEAILRGSIDAINEAYVLYDPQDRLVWCNEKYKEFYARTADLIVPGATFESILRAGAARGQYKDSLGREEEWVQERLRAHRMGTIAMIQLLDDGRWLRVVEQRMPDGHIVGFRIDITELMVASESAKAANAALSEERTRLQNIIEGTNVGTWEWFIDSDAFRLNERCAELVGLSLAELEPLTMQRWVQRSHPDDLPQDNRQMQDHFAGRTEYFATETRLRHADGHWVWVQYRGRVNLRAADGSPLRMAGTYMDITERKSYEMALAQTSATLQAVLDSAVDVGVIATDRSRLIRVFNKGSENLLGYSAAEVVGKRTTSILFELNQLSVIRESLALTLGHEPSVQEVFDQVANGKGQREWSLVRKDGSVFTASMAISPMLDASGEMTGHLGIVHDITRQKEYEASLREAMRQAELSSVAKSQFLANMSHEIRTPMNAILGMLKLLQTTPLSNRQQDYAAKTEGAARSLLGLLNDILDFSKVEAGKMQLDPEPFQLNTLLEDLSVILSSNLGSKNVELLFEVDPQIPPTLIGDALRLKQILINLGGNAVKFTEQGHVTVRCHLLALHTDRAKLEIAVQDSGIGIAPENQARIFEAFTQAEANTTRRYGGTGLGLVISTRLIRLMGGELQLSSTPGTGSTFSFTLDLAVPAQSEVLKLEADPAGAQRLKTLLVDDNPKALASGMSMMASLGWDVAQAASGQEAVACVKERMQRDPLDAIFVDWQMPQMDGWETLRNIRRLYKDQTEVPLLILISSQSREALSQRTDREQELLSGFMVKPLTASMFLQALKNSSVPASVSTPQSTARATDILPLQGMRILLVEDNLINQQVAKELLQGQGAEVALADNGKLGVHAVAQANPQFDAVLMDLQMPVMDGLTAARTLRLNASLSELPIIAMTANAMASDRQACLDAGMNDHVGKPFDLANLVQTLVRHTGWVPHVRESGPADIAAPEPAKGATVAQEVLRQSWPDGVDVVTALARMGGNVGLLQRSMVAFGHDAETFKCRVIALYESGSLADARREIHAFKGLCATLGMPLLSSLAAEAEKLVLAPESQAEFMHKFGVTCQQLDQQMPSLTEVSGRLAQLAAPAVEAVAETTHQSLEVDTSLHEEFQRLYAALESSDMTALELHAQLRQCVPDAWAQAMEPLDAAMADLEFESAAAECKKLLDSILQGK